MELLLLICINFFGMLGFFIGTATEVKVEQDHEGVYECLEAYWDKN